MGSALSDIGRDIDIDSLISASISTSRETDAKDIDGILGSN